MAMTLTPLRGIPLVHQGDDLAGLILGSLEQMELDLEDEDVLVVAQKIISKAEGRLVDLAQVHPSERAISLAKETEKDPRLVEVILRESRQVLRTRPGTIIVEHRLGFVCASAGIDHSNVAEPGLAEPALAGQGLAKQILTGEKSKPDDLVLLLPEDPDASAQRLRQRLQEASGKRLGVVVIDSHGRAWRLGVVGTAIGLAGVPGVVDLRGEPDLFGYRLRITLVGAADELAAAASLVMGQADEGTPVVHVRGFPYELRAARLAELLRSRDEDLFR